MRDTVYIDNGVVVVENPSVPLERLIDSLAYGVYIERHGRTLYIYSDPEVSGLTRLGRETVLYYNPDLDGEVDHNPLPLAVLIALVLAAIAGIPFLLCSIKPDLDVCVDFKRKLDDLYRTVKDFALNILIPIAVGVGVFYVVYRATG
ncbi:MAG: hypothetical protein F7C81_05485 [Desulfurococcales archaeon]|nr:hypothetical protein [Desulfurococcales archaeon]